MSHIRIRPVPADDDAPSPGSTQLQIQPGLIYRELSRVVFLVAGLFLIYRMAGPISAILLLFLLGFILAAVLNPIVVRLEAWGVPRMASAVGLVLLLIGLVALVGWLGLPPLLSELNRFLQQFDPTEVRIAVFYQELRESYPELTEQLPPPTELLGQLAPNVTTLLGQVGRYTMNVAVGLISLLVLLVLVIYIVGRPEPLIAGLLGAFPEHIRGRVETTLQRIMEQLKSWALGSATVGVIVGVITGVGLHLIGIPYALLFGVLAAFGELVPNIGPIVAAVPPLLLALTIDPMLALWTALFFIVLQQVESHLLTPMVLGGKLELHPVSVVFAILVMHTLFGLLGALLAVPVCAMIKVCWEEFYLKPRHTDVDELEQEANEVAAAG